MNRNQLISITEMLMKPTLILLLEIWGFYRYYTVKHSGTTMLKSEVFLQHCVRLYYNTVSERCKDYRSASVWDCHMHTFLDQSNKSTF